MALDKALKRSDGRHELAFAVLLKADNRHVGMTCYLNIEEAHKRLEIGSTWYVPSTWGGPVNPECKLKTDARNARSHAAIRKLGAVQEGILARHMVMADGHIRDSVIFSIVDTGWPKVKAGLEKRLAVLPG